MKILLIDDHALFRDGLSLVLDGLDTAIETFEAGSYEAAEVIMRAQPDLDMVLLDLGLPGTSYLDALRAIRQQLPKAFIVILSGTEDYKVVEASLQNGAQGYIPKSSPAKIMLSALQLVISGGTYVPAQILQLKPVTNVATPITQATEHRLTPRQYDVLQQLATGKSNKAIGSELQLTESTVRAHVAAILKAFNVPNRTHAVQHASQHSWL
ncbi:hypothetical protein MNBD_GAMMA08-2249 [hydrothermal vent metagenome]|uniref:Two-component transcriptional response regulator, LuxR family n=1 Tax=hydrothermal vent metagenome TaxID=652676 RepID=A0A3B0XB81_9ZZZZ